MVGPIDIKEAMKQNVRTWEGAHFLITSSIPLEPNDAQRILLSRLLALDCFHARFFSIWLAACQAAFEPLQESALVFLYLHIEARIQRCSEGTVFRIEDSESQFLAPKV